MRGVFRAVFLVASLVLGSAGSSYATDVSVDKLAPNFVRVDLHDTKVTLVAYRGKVVLLDFWATWCPPCLLEMTRFVDWQKEYGSQGLQVLGVSMDDTEAPVRALYQKRQLNYPVVMGDEHLGKLYGGILGLPVIFLIDRQGKIRGKYEGEIDLRIVESALRDLLSSPAR